MRAIIEVKDLVKEFRTRKQTFRAVDNVSFSLKQGEILGFLGPNGAGKTTTIQMLLSTLSPTSGEIKYFGMDLKTHRTEILQEVSFASSYTKLPWRLSVLENLDVYGRIYGLTKNVRKARSEKFLKYFGAWEIRNKLIAQLSAGQLTRVMLSKAFLSHPKISLLDEPTASLDPEVAHEVRAFVQKQRIEYGVSILYTSHNMDEVAEVCDRVIFLKNGRIVACDTPDRLALEGAQSRVVLIVEDGSSRLIETLQNLEASFEVRDKSFEFHLPHYRTGPFISELGARGIVCSDVHIERPTLEEYFLQLAKEAA